MTSPATIAARKMPVPVADSQFKLKIAASGVGGGHHRRHALHQVVQARDRGCATIGDPVQRSALVCGQAPDEDEHAQDRSRASRRGSTSRARVSRAPLRPPRRGASAARRRPHRSRGCQTRRNERDRAHRDDRRRPRPPARDRGSWRRGTAASRRTRRPRAPPATRRSMPRQPGERPDQPERHDHREERELPADHGAEVAQVEAGDALQRDDRRAQRAERDRRGVGDEREAGGQRAARSRGPIRMAPVTATGVPKPAAPSKNAPKQKAISRSCRRRSRRDAGDALAQDREEPALLRELVQEDHVEDDPADRQQAVGGAERRRWPAPSAPACRRRRWPPPARSPGRAARPRAPARGRTPSAPSSTTTGSAARSVDSAGVAERVVDL